MTFSQFPYARPDFAAVTKQMQNAAAAMRAAADYPAFYRAWMDAEAAERAFANMQDIAEIRYTIDTRDAFYTAEKDFYDETGPKFTALSVEVKKALLDSPFQKEIAAAFGPFVLTRAKIAALGFDERLIEPMVEENRLSAAYEKLLAGCAVEFDGETLNLSGLNKRMQSPERDTRRRAFEAYAAYFAAHEAELDAIFDQLVHLRDGMGRAMGYDNFIPLAYLRLGRSDYDAAQVAQFRAQIVSEIVPVCQRLRQAQAARLGLPGLKFYDEGTFYRAGNAAPKGDTAFMIEQAQRLYDGLSPETGAFFSMMRAQELMDLETKPGKANGGYCTTVSGHRVPFIFSNFNGTNADADVLTHEAGHAFQASTTMQNQTLGEYTWGTYEVSEIHSTSMEFFAYPWMDGFFGDDAPRYKKQHATESFTFLPYGALVDAFQHEIYEKPDMTPKERRACWSRLERTYLPWRDYDGDSCFAGGAAYFRQLHIFMDPFYYIDYVLASVSAFEFYKKMNEDRGAAWADYMTLCRLGGSRPYLELLQAAHLHNPFEKGSVAEVVKPIRAFIEA